MTIPPSTTGNLANPYSAPQSHGTNPHDVWGEVSLFQRDVYFLRQKLFAINERYSVFDEHGNPLIFVRRKAKLLRNLLVAATVMFGIFLGLIVGIILTMQIHLGLGLVAGLALAGLGIGLGIWLVPLRHLEFFADADYTQPLMDISQDNRGLLFVSTFTLRDPQGQTIAHFQKNILWNLIRRRWLIRGPDKQMLHIVKEDSIIKALLRRFAPDFIAVFLRTNFVFLGPEGQLPVLGAFNRAFAIRDNYTLDMSKDSTRQVDRRVALAMGVLLDTGERR